MPDPSHPTEQEEQYLDWREDTLERLADQIGVTYDEADEIVSNPTRRHDFSAMTLLSYWHAAIDKLELETQTH
jgi:hypothetical protein